jgi:hypothetical protein
MNVASKAAAGVLVALVAGAAAHTGVATAATDPCGQAPEFSTYEAKWHELAEGEWMAQYEAATKAWEACEEAEEAKIPVQKVKPRHFSAKELKKRRATRAAVRKAENAVAREFHWDYGDSRQVSVFCTAVTGRFACTIHTWQWNGRYNELIQGKARVSKQFKVVDFRIYW